jgi:hypothetical protein
MKNKTLYTTAAISAIVAAVALNVTMPDVADAQDATTAADGLVDTTAAVKAANWSDNVTITVDADANTFRFESNGMPSHGFAEKYLIPTDPSDQPFADKPAEFFKVEESAPYFKETPVDTTITTLPAYTEEVTDTSLGRIGVAITGAQIFNDYENPERSVVAQDDQVIHDHVAFLDECNGHTLVSGTDYHYHGIPVCITDTLDKADEHSVMIGVLEDGFPVYGNHGQGGTIVTNEDLDACSGHVDVTPEFPDGIYHYHLTADEAPYMIDCYHGEIELVANMGGGGPDFAAIAKELGVEEAALRDALGDTMPPDFDAAAQSLGIDGDKLRGAMPGPGQ